MTTDEPAAPRPTSTDIGSISDPVDQRVALARACRAYLDGDVRDPLLYATVLGVYDAADDLLATMDVEDG